MDERITIRLNKEDKKELMRRSDWIFSNVSHILRSFITFINTLPEAEAETFLKMLREFKPSIYVQDEEVAATMRG